METYGSTCATVIGHTCLNFVLAALGSVFLIDVIFRTGTIGSVAFPSTGSALYAHGCSYAVAILFWTVNYTYFSKTIVGYLINNKSHLSFVQELVQPSAQQSESHSMTPGAPPMVNFARNALKAAVNISTLVLGLSFVVCQFAGWDECKKYAMMFRMSLYLIAGYELVELVGAILNWARGLSRFPRLMIIHHSISILGSPPMLFQLIENIYFAVLVAAGVMSASCIVVCASLCKELGHSKKTVLVLRTCNLGQHIATRFFVLPILAFVGGAKVWGTYNKWCLALSVIAQASSVLMGIMSIPAFYGTVKSALRHLKSPSSSQGEIRLVPAAGSVTNPEYAGATAEECGESVEAAGATEGAQAGTGAGTGAEAGAGPGHGMGPGPETVGRAEAWDFEGFAAVTVWI
eukprot:NODE_6541_length_1662_cov_9.749186.p1 GENE.NODE_6541_length_1662_cov_9.749186~~NODE_6541_length_1662_cov_9.749186.p1  ORF type:complete len:404 (-),score=-16.14 NODE_6541_length_1662_cov_9.749186:314-1525(-)